jgi:glycosyltransferase involved in cell wall biosynthesis
MSELRNGMTVVVTVFNKAYILPLVISSMKRQRCPLPLEFIFVDDGSSDDSVAMICRLAGDIDDVLVVSQKNAGPTRAFNLGLSLSNTVYTKGLDGDDILAPNALATLLDALVAHRECRWAYGAGATFETFHPDIDAIFATTPPSDPADVVTDQLRKSLRRPHTNPSAWLAETAFLRAIDFCDPAVFIQDFSLELRMAANSPVAVTSSILFYSQSIVTERRISSNGRQILHDVNAAVANFFSDHPEYLADYGWEAAQRVAGRAWHWARRHEGRTVLSREYRDFIASRLRLGDPLRIMNESRDSFGEGVRKPAPGPAPFEVLVAKGCFASDPALGAAGR